MQHICMNLSFLGIGRAYLSFATKPHLFIIFLKNALHNCVLVNYLTTNSLFPSYNFFRMG
jgi:hypothetical protein